jgi:drug/metabolite transporter (DMT)-like permease
MSVVEYESPPRPPRSRTPLRVWVGLLIAVALDVPVQIVWKELMTKFGLPPTRTQHGPIPGHEVIWFIHQNRLYWLFALWGLQFLDWIWVLGNADLSFAQPFTALSYVAVSTFAVIRLGEHMSPARGVGIVLILTGVILIGSSDHKTHLALPVEQP